jgi:nitrogen regulatory protein PII
LTKLSQLSGEWQTCFAFILALGNGYSEVRNTLKLVFIVLNTVELLEEIIEYMVEQGVRGGTVLDSVGMGRILAYDIPIFAGFRDLMVGARANNRTMMTTIPDEIFDEFMEGLDRIVHFDEPGTGVAFAVDIYKTYGVK